MNQNMINIYNSRACIYAEKYGIFSYKVKGNILTYYVSYEEYLREPKHTVKHVVNLDTLVETTTRLTRFNPDGLNNRG